MPKTALNPLIAAGTATFNAERQALVAEHASKWVAYRGRERLGIAPRPDALYAMAPGVPESELLIRHIEAGDDDAEIECRLVDLEGDWPAPLPHRKP